MDVSVIIPAYNRKDRLKCCLESLFRQDYPQDNFEIIVVDDASTDGTVQMLRVLSGNNHNLRYFSQPHRGPAAARNLGIKEAKAEIVCFTDNDCILKSDWVRKMVEGHRRESMVSAMGGLTNAGLRNIKALVSQSLSDGAIKANVNARTEIIFFPTCNVSFKKSHLNGERFNELFIFPAGEDLEFFWRLYKKGLRFIERQDIEIFHNCHPDFKSFLRQAYMYGRGNYLVQHIHKDHLLLKELKTENGLSFLAGLVINFAKIPRFSYISGRRLIRLRGSFNFYERFAIYFHFALHKIMYLLGNILEYRRIRHLSRIVSPRAIRTADESLAKPEFIILDITHRCNLKCNICEIRKDGSIKEFTSLEVKNLIAQAIEWGVKEFVLSGGEPFVRNDIFGILDFVNEKKYHIGILTNGILLNEDFIKRLLPYLASDRLSLSVSLDALTPEIHDDIRGAKGCFERTFNGLKILSKLKKEYQNINFNTISIILNENLEELLPLAELLKSLNVNSIQFQPLLANNLIMNRRSGMVKYWLSQERLPLLDKAIAQLIEFKKQNFNLVRNSENNLNLARKYFRSALGPDEIRCLYADRTMLIANNGDVTTCLNCYGNARRGILKEIYFSREAEMARRNGLNCETPCLLPCFTDYSL